MNYFDGGDGSRGTPVLVGGGRRGMRVPGFVGGRVQRVPLLTVFYPHRGDGREMENGLPTEVGRPREFREGWGGLLARGNDVGEGRVGRGGGTLGGGGFSGGGLAAASRTTDRLLIHRGLARRIVVGDADGVGGVRGE